MLGWTFEPERAVVPGDHRETRDPFQNLPQRRSGMDPGSPLRCARDDGAEIVEGQFPSCWRRIGAVIVFLLATLAPAPATAQVRSTTEFLSPDMRRQQADETRNPAYFWVEQGQDLFSAKPDGVGQACISCHAEPKQSLRGAATHYPQVDSSSGQLLNLEGRIEQCRVERQKQPAFGYESTELLAMTAYIGSLSRGMPLDAATDGPAKPFYEAGKAFFERRQGQLNLSCKQCHDGLVGQHLRGDVVSHGAGTGYPAYRLEWNSVGSLHRRLRACSLGVRATQFDYGAPEYLALELYLAGRAKGLSVETPGIRR